MGRPFSYLLVDEFQDISPLQFQLILAWNQAGKELFVIGDPDQSIYGFRGADAECFDRLEQAVSSFTKIHLKENYRSAPPITESAAALISHNRGGERILIPHEKGGQKIRIVKTDSEFSEAIFIAKEIESDDGRH